MQDAKPPSMMRSFIPHNLQSFSTKELEDIKHIFIKAIYKTAEQIY
jgi:hypothetical protein